MCSTNGKSNDSGSYENEIHDDEDGLELSHNFRHDRREDCVAEDTGKKGSIDSAIGWCPIPIAGDDDDGEEH